MYNDIRYAFRMLIKTPGFTIAAVVTLALGIGATTAIFSVVNAVLLRPLRYKDPERLVLIREAIPKLGGGSIPVSAPDVLDFQQPNQVFENVAAFESLGLDLSGVNEPERLAAARISYSLFPLLGVPPMLGRSFSLEEDRPGQNVVILGYGLWQRRFAADPLIIGKTLTLNRNVYTVMGVMPSSFQFPQIGTRFAGPAELWVPMRFSAEELSQRGDNFNIGVIARLKPGVSFEQANADLKSIAARIRENYPPAVGDDFDLTAYALPLKEEVVGNVRRLLLVLLGAVTVVLLIACANVANLLLARAASHRREMAIRTALGAGRFSLLRQILAECLLLALSGAGLGLLVAVWGTDLLVSFTADTLPRAREIRLDLRVLGFALGLSLFTSVLFGLAPFLHLSRVNLSGTLNEGTRNATSGAGRGCFRAGLVVCEITLSMVLLVCAGLFIRSFQLLSQTDPGFRPQQVLTMTIALPQSSYRTEAQVFSFYQQLIERLEQLPGVLRVGAGTDLPLQSTWTRLFTAEGWKEPPSGISPTNAHTVVFGNYLSALGIPLKRGRFFTDQDRVGTSGVLLINETMARRFWPNEDPLGKRLKWGLPQAENPWLTIVGVVGDVKDGRLNAETRPHTYEPYLQNRQMRSLRVVLRGARGPENLAAAMRAQVLALDRDLPVSDLQTMEQVIVDSVAPQRFNTILLGSFAAVAVILASVGIYGVMSYLVTQRTPEMGVRMALGAQQKDVFRLVVRQGMGLVLIGLAMGLVGALGATRLLSNLLYGIGTTDPATYTAVSLLLIGVALVASVIPAYRASKVNPIVALRYE